MPATSAAYVENPTAPVVQKLSPKPRLSKLEAYFRKYRDLEDGFKYELVNGTVEKTPRTMTPAQTFVLNNLMRRFLTTKAFKDGGNLFVEIEMLTKPEQIRKPDICYRSSRQIASGDFSPSEFVVEVMSPNDKIDMVKQKVREYFAAGVKVVWHIFPNAQEIEVFTSPRRSEVFSGEEVVSAAPAIPDFSMKVEDVFKKPVVVAA
jgi:Uma2 family endonuclease